MLEAISKSALPLLPAPGFLPWLAEVFKAAPAPPRYASPVLAQLPGMIEEEVRAIRGYLGRADDPGT